MDSGCDVHFTKSRCWISKDDGKELSRGRASGTAFGTPGPAAGAALDGDGEPTVRIKVPVKGEHCMKLRDTCLKLVSMVHCGASGGSRI